MSSDDDQDAEKHLTLALDALDDAEVSYHVRTALSKLQAREERQGGESA